MKQLALPLIALSLMASCGKENKSGKSSWDYSQPGLSQFNSGSVPGDVNQIFSRVTCMGGYSQSTNNRMQMQLPLTGFQTMLPAGDIYVGITSYGDVGVLRGMGTTAPVFIAYLCPRDFTNFQGSQLSNVRVGSYSNCNFKPLASATLQFPSAYSGMAGSAEFRMLDFGTFNGSTLVPISGICR